MYIINFSILASIINHIETYVMDEKTQSDYHFNLFQPLTDYGRRIRNLILIMLAVWAVGVFGFQVLLRVLEKPVAEPALNDFQYSLASIQDGNESMDVKLTFLHSLLMVEGKNVVKPADKEVLKSWISLTFRNLSNDSIMNLILAKQEDLKLLKAELQNSSSINYQQIRDQIIIVENDLCSETSRITGYSPKSLETTILVGSLQNLPPMAEIASPEIEHLSNIMNLYLIHNRSVLTDTPFLGFPFHYFYTAVFLLILFVGLCLLYNLRLDRRMKIEHINE